MRRLIALVIIGLLLAIAFIQFFDLAKARPGKAERQPPLNYFQQLHDCGAACLPVAAVLVVMAE